MWEVNSLFEYEDVNREAAECHRKINSRVEGSGWNPGPAACCLFDPEELCGLAEPGLLVAVPGVSTAVSAAEPDTLGSTYIHSNTTRSFKKSLNR